MIQNAANFLYSKIVKLRCRENVVFRYVYFMQNAKFCNATVVSGN